MEAFVWIAHTLEASFLACFVVVVLGLFVLVARASRLARNSQAQREASFLVQTALAMPIHRHEGHWRRDDLRDAA